MEELGITDKNSLIAAEVTYAFLYFGIGEKSTELILAMNHHHFTKAALDKIEKRFENCQGDKFFLERYLDPEKIRGFKLFNGHQRSLGHYFRHLYQTVKFVENSSLDFKEKYEYIKILRAQFTSQEVSILFFHSLSSLGYGWTTKKWTRNDSGKKVSLIEKYHLIGNIPLNGYNSADPKHFYEDADFDWEWDKIIGFNLEEEFRK